MPARDSFDLPIAGADTAVATGYDRYVHEFLSYGANLRDLFAIADDAPDCALANAHAAALQLAFEGAEGWTNAAPYLERMRRARTWLECDRERLFCDAVEAWAARDFHNALAALDELTVRWPADLCAIKWAQYHAFNLGDQAGMLRLGARAMTVHENQPYVHGMIAFALEQNHRLGEAEEEGMKAVEIAIDDAWAHHAVAHVFETEGRAIEGARWMRRCAHTWENKGVFIRDHNWWHIGLFHLGLDEPEKALNIYDERLWGAWPEFPQEQIGAASMLWRLELHGVDVGGRWSPVVDQVRPRAGEHVFPFHDLHYLMALLRGGSERETDQFIRSLSEHAEKQSGATRDIWLGACMPAARAIKAFAERNYDDAARDFAKAMPRLHSIGGSHAQRGVFVETNKAALNALETGGAVARY